MDGYSIHATALATFAETIGGLALMSTLKNKDRAILVSLRMEVRLLWSSREVKREKEMVKRTTKI